LADLLLNRTLASPKDVEEREERRRQTDHLERLRSALVRHPPKPEEELAGELGHVGFMSGFRRHWCDPSNHLWYKLYTKQTEKELVGTMSAKKATQTKGFTAEERAAMKERAQELKAEAAKADGESALLAKVAEMKGPDRAMAKRLHAIIKASAPVLSPKTWYGMPAYAKDGKVVCYFQSAEKFNSRYATFGFSDEANLDEGAMWPTSFALKELTAVEEAKIGALVKKAVN
jgi:uncharacterized protein YdhG (YjbR/CyaY superfamily)